MAKSLGIDPGTKSFDMVLIDKDRILWEKSVPTHKIARDPDILIKAIREIGDYDIITGPSGYGSPVLCNEDIVDPWTYALEILLLTPIKQMEKGLQKQDPGIMVYKALAESVRKLWIKNEPVCYIPSVILLDTVPLKYKLNKIDLGTADKMAATLLGIHYASKFSGKKYEDLNLLYVESGYGYNALVKVTNGQITEGYGGTIMEQGFLTAGPIDLEVVVMGGRWERTDVFHGGVATACNSIELEEAIKKTNSPYCKAAVERMIDSITERITAITKLYNIDYIILSGRNMRINNFRNEIIRRIEKGKTILSNIKLEDNASTKEAAQGYAIVGEGLKEGYFKTLIEHTRIKHAKGTVMDYIIHPRLKKAVKKHYQAYRKSIRKEKLEEILNK